MLAYLTVSKASLAHFTHVPREESKRRSLLLYAKPILDRPVTLDKKIDNLYNNFKELELSIYEVI